MRTLRILALACLLMTGGCRLLAEFLVDAVTIGIDIAIDGHDDGCRPPPGPPPHRSPRVPHRTRHP